MKISLYTLGFGILLALIMFLFIWRASKKELKYSVLKMVAIIISAVFSIIGAKQLSGTFGTFLYDNLLTFLSPEYSDLLKSMGEVGNKACNMLIAPIIFMLIFIVLYVIISAVGKSILCIVSKKKTKNNKNNIVAKIIAGVNALLFFAFVTMPFSAYASFMCSFAENVFLPLSECEKMYENKEIRAGSFYSGDVNGFVLKIQDDVIIPADKDIICSTAYNAVGTHVMKILTECEIDGEKAVLAEEWYGITRNMGNIIILFSDSKTDYSVGIKAEALYELTDDGNSDLVKASVSGMLGFMANKWSNNESFLKFTVPDNCGTDSLQILIGCDKSNVNEKILQFINSINNGNE